MPEDAPNERTWQDFPPPKRGDEHRRGRLLGLFQPTTSGEEVEELIAERGRELEERTRQLTDTIADLELREERARKLRASVEQMLRQGSAELDERQDALAALAREIAEREARVDAAEKMLADRRSELGAVELRRAAVERRETALAERAETLDAIARDLTDRQVALEEAEQRVAALEQQLSSGIRQPAAVDDATEHLVLLPLERYRFESREGPAPATGAIVEVEGTLWRVIRVAPSGFPGDARRVAVLEPAPDAV